MDFLQVCPDQDSDCCSGLLAPTFLFVTCPCQHRRGVAFPFRDVRGRVSSVEGSSLKQGRLCLARVRPWQAFWHIYVACSCTCCYTAREKSKLPRCDETEGCLCSADAVCIPNILLGPENSQGFPPQITEPCSSNWSVLPCGSILSGDDKGSRKPEA